MALERDDGLLYPEPPAPLAAPLGNIFKSWHEGAGLDRLLILPPKSTYHHPRGRPAGRGRCSASLGGQDTRQRADRAADQRGRPDLDEPMLAFKGAKLATSRLETCGPFSRQPDRAVRRRDTGRGADGPAWRRLDRHFSSIASAAMPARALQRGQSRHRSLTGPWRSNSGRSRARQCRCARLHRLPTTRAAVSGDTLQRYAETTPLGASAQSRSGRRDRIPRRKQLRQRRDRQARRGLADLWLVCGQRSRRKPMPDPMRRRWCSASGSRASRIEQRRKALRRRARRAGVGRAM